MDPIIKRLIISYKKDGYRIKIPGGNERDDTFAAFGAVVRYNFDRLTWQITLIAWRPRTLEEEKNKKEMKYSEMPIQTVAREVAEETGILLLKYSRIYQRDIKDKRPGHEHEMHPQYLYVCKDFDGSNRRRRPSPSQPNIEPPFWADLDDQLEKEIAIEHLLMIQEVRQWVKYQHIPKKKFKQVPSGKKYESAAA